MAAYVAERTSLDHRPSAHIEKGAAAILATLGAITERGTERRGGEVWMQFDVQGSEPIPYRVQVALIAANTMLCNCRGSQFGQRFCKHRVAVLKRINHLTEDHSDPFPWVSAS